ncbi:DNA cytosine methyltransferase [Amycolatopsis kentuckyensis]|uniref:DNA cytosine methyltransferase n=1 Tax=Amycolatopsis kentuckyensis TaxID=218823 RepID=UPI000A38A540|nr:DNA cytosine methyltransferase [Amycolatopsis kentuckyensis]
MRRKRILDACCCSGGAAKGYHDAGFEVVGVDIAPQPNYPYEFHQGDAIEFIDDHGHEFDAAHISPPCQNACALTAGNRRRAGWTDNHIDLIPPARAALARLRARTGIPTVLENVQGSKLRRDLTLCGLAFALRVFRHRYFEIDGFTVDQPPRPSHRGHRVAGWRHGVRYDGDMVAVYGDGGGKGSITEWQDAMGIHHTDVRREIAEAIPPAYTRHIGTALLAHLAAVPAAA